MSQTTKVLIFIASIFVLLFLNAALLIHESKSGMRLSRWLTFLLPLTILYFVIFRSGGNASTTELTRANTIATDLKQPEENESDILARELHDPEVEWQEINEWPLDKVPIVDATISHVEEAPSAADKHIEQLERLSKLRAEGHLTEDEYNLLKAKLLSS